MVGVTSPIFFGYLPCRASDSLLLRFCRLRATELRGRLPFRLAQNVGFPDGVNDRVPLFVLVNEFPLVRRTNIQLAAETNNTGFIVILIAFRRFLDRNFFEFDFHYLPIPVLA